jgi:type II secretory pathway pseudopilin PulG
MQRSRDQLARPPLAVRVGRFSVRGTSLVEIMVVLSIVVVAAGLFSRIVIATSRLRDVNRDNAIAAEAARKILEEIRGTEFRKVFRLYDPDPNDDPNGPGTAPGHRHDVAGLAPTADSPDGKVLEVLMPAYPPASTSRLIGTEWEELAYGPSGGSTGGTTGGSTGGKTGKTGKVGGTSGGGGSGSSTSTTWELREDYQDEGLGLPRDLNGDSILDSLDHSKDYILLPILIRVKWEGENGPRVFEVYTMLSDYRKST